MPGAHFTCHCFNQQQHRVLIPDTSTHVLPPTKVHPLALSLAHLQILHIHELLFARLVMMIVRKRRSPHIRLNLSTVTRSTINIEINCMVESHVNERVEVSHLCRIMPVIVLNRILDHRKHYILLSCNFYVICVGFILCQFDCIFILSLCLDTNEK